MIDAITDDDASALSYRHERLAAIFLGMPAMGAHDAIARAKEVDGQERQQRRARGGRLNLDLRQLQTPTQRGEAR